jgi:diaminopimelate decarboxylase
LKAWIKQVNQLHGTQPFFIYDLDAMATHLTQFKVPGVKFWYATKANPLSQVVRTAFDCGLGIDCASAGEFRQALRVGVPPAQILLTGPSKPKKLLKEALLAGLKHFVLESVQQALDLEALAREMNVKVDALLRLQITWSETESSVLGGGKISPFGLDAKGWQSLPIQEFRQIQIRGIHCFQWGNILDPERLLEIWLQTADEAKTLASRLNLPLEVLDIGGGLGIPYHGERELKFETVQTQLLRLKSELPETEIWMELGRYAIGPFGHYVTEVVDRKTVHGKEFLVLEGGVHHLVRPALIKEAFPAQIFGHSPGSLSTLEYEVHGPLCTSLDHLGTYTFSKDVKPGDQIIFSQVGAYGFTESMPFFLCHDLPAEFVILQQKLLCLREWKTPETWLV